jgi:hypothetical protein
MMAINVVIDTDRVLGYIEIARELLDKARASIAMSEMDAMDSQHFKCEIKKLIEEIDEIISSDKKR